MKHKETLSPLDIKERRQQLFTDLKAHPESRSATKAYADFIDKKVIPQMSKNVTPYTFEDYFLRGLRLATKSLREGNHAVGALYIYRTGDGFETILAGRQEVISKNDTHLHAEEESIDWAEKLNRGKLINHDTVLLRRRVPDNLNVKKKILFAYFEPCLGCYRRLTTHKPDEVWIATPDPNGAMLDGRQEQLPGIWANRTQRRNIEVVRAGNDPTIFNYINPEHLELATEMLEARQAYIDKTVTGMNEDPRTFITYSRRSARRGIFRYMF